MGRNSIQLNPQHPIAELKRHYQKCTCAVERRRAHVIWLLASGKSRDEVIQLTAYSLPSVLDAIHRYNQNGLEGLRDLRHTNPGAPTLLSDQEFLLLARTIRKDFEKGIVWNGKDVQTWIQTNVLTSSLTRLALVCKSHVLVMRKAAMPPELILKKHAPKRC
jgi:transposase